MPRNPVFELPDGLSLIEAQFFVKLIIGFQEAWLKLVEHCHTSSLEETLDCCRHIQGDAITKIAPNTTIAESMNSALTTVLSRFYDHDKDNTLAELKKVFQEIDLELRPQLAEREREENMQRPLA